MKKILFILTSPEPYGAELSILSNIEYLQRKKKIKPIFIVRSKGKLEKILKKKNYEYYIVPFFFWVTSRKNILKSIIKIFLNIYLAIRLILKTNLGNIDIVYSNTFTSHFGIILSNILKIKHYFHVRELNEEQFNLKYDFSKKKIFTIANKYSSLFIFNSKFLLNKYKLYLDKKKFRVLPNPIDENYINKNNFDLKKLKIIFIGRLMPDQNPFILIDIAKKLKKMNIQIDVYGEGILKKKLIYKIKKEKLEKILKIKGYKEKIYNQLKNYNLGLCLGYNQTFNRTIVEYMKSGIVVLANNSGNNKNLINNNLNGFLIKNNNPRLYCDKINFLYKNKKKIKMIGTTAYKNFKDKFTAKHSSKKLNLLIYEKI